MDGKKLKLGSLFSGSGGFELAGCLHGIEPVWSSEIEKFCLRVEALRFPNCKQLGSVTDINGAEVEPVDIITFGSPCFPAGTLVNTADGLKPIENVTVADSVLSHTGVYRQVLDAKYTGTKQIMRLKAMGVHKIDATPNHLFYAKRDDVTRWTPLSELKQGDYIAAPRIQVQENPLCLTMEECWLIGRYIADGYTRIGQRPDRPDGSSFSTVVFCVGAGKELEFESNVKQHAFGKSAMSRNVVKYTICGSRLTQLCELCGHGAENKHIPVFLLNLPNDLLRKVISGYMSGDGCKTCNVFKATTVSKHLVYTLSQAVSKTYGYPCRIYEIPVPEITVIEGRTVNQKTQWQIVFKTDVSVKDKAHSDADYVWLPVRSVELLEKKEAVYDITVAEDHSFCVQNIAVHNCQDLSVAGKQLGIHDGQRSNLFFEAIRIIKEMREHDRAVGRADFDVRPRFAVWENVPGAFSSNKGADFLAVLQAFAEIGEKGTDVSVPFPEKGKWLPAGTVVGDGWSVAWRVYDAQYWGVPQRRKRIYLIADFGSERAGEILFERESVCGDSAESGEAREGTAADAQGSVGRSDSVRCMNPWDCQSKRQYSVDGVYRTLDAGNCAGGQAHGVVYPINTMVATRGGKDDMRTCFGIGEANDPQFTISAAHEHGVCYALDSMSSNSMKSSNPHSGFHEETITKTLDTNPDPTCNQGGNVIVQKVCYSIEGNTVDRESNKNGKGYCEDVSPTLNTQDKHAVTYAIEGNGQRKSHQGDGYSETDKMYTLNTIERHAVCYRKSSKPGADGKGEKWVEDETANTLNTFEFHSEVRTPEIVCYEGQNVCCDSQRAFTLQSGRPDQQHIPSVVYRQDGFAGYSEGVGTLKASGGDMGGVRKASSLSVFDARGNGNGETVPTITGDHQNRVSDYTCICVERNHDE